MAQQTLEQMCNDLGIGARIEAQTFSDEFGLEFGIILNDAVVHERHIRGEVRVGIVNCCGTVGRPARVTKPRNSRYWDTGQHLAQGIQLPNCPTDVDAAKRILDCNPCTVIAAIFKARETFNQTISNI